MNDAEILKHIARQARQTASYKQLVRELGVEGTRQRRELAFQLKSMVRRGELREAVRDHFTLAAAGKKGLVSGRLRMHPDGYGFVTPDDLTLRARIAGDIFINPQATAAAMDGDRVLVELGVIRPSGRAEGRIVSVVEREHATVVGIFHYGSRNNHVVPIDEKITREIVIPRGLEIPAGEHDQYVAEEPHDAARSRSKPERFYEKKVHRVYGEEASKRARTNDLEGLVVDVEITDWPSLTQHARGRVIEILGGEDDFGVDVEMVIRKHHLRHRFSREAVEEAQAISHVIAQREYAARRDFRDLPIVTIDGETARDFDDAVLVRRRPNRNYELQVHIADVAHYVTAASALDSEARLRGTSVYFPDRAVPMLPIELSTDICSLRPQVDRLVMSAIMEIDHQGELVGYELGPGVIRSAARMTYTDVNAVLEGDEILRQKFRALAGEFERMKELALILNRKRMRRGSIDFDLPEPVIEFDEQGLMQGVTRSERNIAHRIIEEFMLAANECVATQLEQAGVPSIYRIHEKPDAKKIYDFETIAAAFGYSLGVGALPIQRMTLRADRRMKHASGGNPRAIEIPQEVHLTPRMYQKLAEKIAGKPEERILSYLMLRSLKQARYSEKNEGHFALAAQTYTHFTSPIRRYPDLIVHRILKAVLGSQLTAHDRQVPGSQLTVPAQKHGTQHNPVIPSGGEHREPKSRDNAFASHEKRETRNQKPVPQTRNSKLLSESELHAIAESSSETERRADDAERELMEWKQLKFMQQRLGEEFAGLVVSVTRYGLFVELEELFIEGLVPLASLEGDRFTFRENTRQIIGERSRKTYSLGNRVRVLVDRIDHVQRKIQFALVEEVVPRRKQRR